MDCKWTECNILYSAQNVWIFYSYFTSCIYYRWCAVTLILPTVVVVVVS